ncbi:MAG: CRISPR system precrRNA processing endoribonuclease RAMP protein Cas6 [Ignisphaera sp.]
MFLSTDMNRHIYSVDVYFTVKNSIPLYVWNGMYLYKELLRMFEEMGLSFNHRARKPFTISPIVDIDDRYVDVLEPDKVYRFRFSTLNIRLFEVFRKALHENQDIFNVIRMEVGSVDLSTHSLSFRLSTQSKSTRCLVLIDIRFLPTLFKFHGHAVLYPSPQRFLASILRDLYLATGIDLRKQLKHFVYNFEIISYRTRITKLYIGKSDKNIDRYVRTFYGKVRYIAVVEQNNIQLLNLLLNIARNLGVGKNRAIGLGDIRITNINIKTL